MQAIRFLHINPSSGWGWKGSGLSQSMSIYSGQFISICYVHCSWKKDSRSVYITLQNLVLDSSRIDALLCGNLFPRSSFLQHQGRVHLWDSLYHQTKEILFWVQNIRNAAAYSIITILFILLKKKLYQIHPKVDHLLYLLLSLFILFYFFKLNWMLVVGCSLEDVGSHVASWICGLIKACQISHMGTMNWGIRTWFQASLVCLAKKKKKKGLDPPLPAPNSQWHHVV